MCIRCLLFLVACFGVGAARAQETMDWEQLLFNLSQMEEYESATWDSYYELFEDLQQNPININTATREDLEQFPFLTEQEVNGILAYIERYDGMKSFGELVIMKDIDYYKKRLLMCFTYVGERKKPLFPTMRQLRKYGKHQALVQASIPCYKREGDDDAYLGDGTKHGIKYSFSYGDRVKLGMVASKDAGEPFFAHGNSCGYDYYSFYLLLKKLGRVEALVVGRYRLHMGLGLVMNNNNSYGKWSALNTLFTQTSTLRAHTTRSSSNYLQGAAITLDMGSGWEATAFASYRKLDATLNNDDGSIATILTTDYHRTETEMNKKNNVAETDLGAHVGWREHGFHVGLTAVYSRFDRPLSPDVSQLYKRYYAHGQQMFNASMDYGYTGHRFRITGETATGSCGAMATLNALRVTLSDKVQLVGVQRFYSKRYFARYARSFSEGGKVQNESAMYVGLWWRPWWNLQVSAYTDISYFPWPRYQVRGTSYAYDHLVQAVYSSDRWQGLLRYRWHGRQMDNATKTGLSTRDEHRLRLNAAYQSVYWGAKLQLDGVYVHYNNTSKGWMLSADWHAQPWKPLKAYIHCGYFHTDDYDSRQYAYERGLTSTYNVSMFYGQGIRYSFWLQTTVIPHLTFTAKVGTTNYFDRNRIGTGNQAINQSWATDIALEAKVKF